MLVQAWHWAHSPAVSVQKIWVPVTAVTLTAVHGRIWANGRGRGRVRKSHQKNMLSKRNAEQKA